MECKARRRGAREQKTDSAVANEIDIRHDFRPVTDLQGLFAIHSPMSSAPICSLCGLSVPLQASLHNRCITLCSPGLPERRKEKERAKKKEQKGLLCRRGGDPLLLPHPSAAPRYAIFPGSGPTRMPSNHSRPLAR